MIRIQFDNNFDWLGLEYGLVYPTVVVACGHMRQDKIGKSMKNMMRISVEEGFQLARVKVDKDVERGTEALGMGNSCINI